MSNFSKLEYDIKQMLQGNHARENLELDHDTAKKIITLAKNVAVHTLDMVNHNPTRTKDTDDLSIRMSEIGEPCHRKLMYKWYRPEWGQPPFAENPEPFLPVKFTFGDYIEELTLFLCNESGHPVIDRQREVTYRPLGSDWHAVGHIDAMVDDYVVDVKSAADGSFSKYKREGLTEANDTFGYLWQLDSYSVALENKPRAIIFTNKHDGNLHIVDRTDEPYLPVDKMIDTIGRTADQYLSTTELPVRMPTKVTKYGDQLGTVCSYCAFKWKCYDGGIHGVISSGRPMYFESKSLTKEGIELVKEKANIPCPSGAVPF